MSEAMLPHLNIRLFQWIHAGAGRHPFWDLTSLFFSEGGPYLLMVVFIVSWFGSYENKKIILIEATEASVIGLFLNQLIGLFYFHPRPYMAGLCTPLIRHGPETSFPSDHATFLFAATIYLLVRRWHFHGLLLLFVAFMTAWGRVYSGIHFPFDMFGSLVVGIVSAFLALIFKSHLSPLNRLTVRAYEKGKIYLIKMICLSR